MDWITTFIILGCNVLTVLICRYAYPVRNEYKDGMILWTHIPAWAVQRKEVQDHVEQSQKQWKWYHCVGFIFGVGICLLGAISLELSIIVWIVWITVYIAGCYILLVKIYRKMLRIKKENQWYDEKTMRIRLVQNPEENGFIPRYMDDDDYWKNGWYSNPNDKRFLVNDKFCSSNMSFNMARPGARLLVGCLSAVALAVLVWCIYLFIPLVHIEFIFTKSENEFKIEGGGYEVEFTAEEIKSVELLQEEIGESFNRKNGFSSDEYQIGRFKGSESGKAMLFLFRDIMPVLKIELEDQTIFLNSKETAETKNWYDLCALDS